MRKIRFLFNAFSRVTACVVIAVAAFTTILEPTDTVETAVLWQIPAVSALCALTCLIYPWDRTLGKAEMGIRTLIHYLLINGIVLGAGFWFHWYRIEITALTKDFFLCSWIVNSLAPLRERLL